VEFEDRIQIATPEGVDLELTLAGLGSRFVAELIDVLIQIVIVVVIALGLSALGGYGEAMTFLVFFAVLFLYHPFFELTAGGRTPGKRWTGLRVVMEGGEAIGLRASAIRNVIRILDFLPSIYLIGSISILVTARNQRIGDLAANTIVVRERRATATKETGAASWTAAPVTRVPAAEAWDVSGISAGELAAVRSFLQRRHELTLDARNHLATELARRLAPKVAGVQPGVEGERFLETLAAAKAARG
jgi:uncharacterized RDD family membrane protein YckC